MIEIRNISKRFNGNEVLRNIWVNYEEGKTNLIIGQSGSGKTVLLKTMVGIYQPDEGEVLFDGISLNTQSSAELRELRKNIRMLFHGGSLFDSYTVVENIKFPLDMFTQMTEKEKKERVRYCLERVNLENAGKLYPSQLSGGMQKRAAIARAIVLNPRYLFCDEPNSGLDPQTATVIDQLIKDITKEFNITTILNTHDMNSVLELGEKVVFLHQGTKAWEGTKDDIFNSGNELLNEFIFATTLAKHFRK